MTPGQILAIEVGVQPSVEVSGEVVNVLNVLVGYGVAFGGMTQGPGGGGGATGIYDLLTGEVLLVAGGGGGGGNKGCFNFDIGGHGGDAGFAEMGFEPKPGGASPGGRPGGAGGGSATLDGEPLDILPFPFNGGGGGGGFPNGGSAGASGGVSAGGGGGGGGLSFASNSFKVLFKQVAPEAGNGRLTLSYASTFEAVPEVFTFFGQREEITIQPSVSELIVTAIGADGGGLKIAFLNQRPGHGMGVTVFGVPVFEGEVLSIGVGGDGKLGALGDFFSTWSPGGAGGFGFSNGGAGGDSNKAFFTRAENRGGSGGGGSSGVEFVDPEPEIIVVAAGGGGRGGNAGPLVSCGTCIGGNGGDAGEADGSRGEGLGGGQGGGLGASGRAAGQKGQIPNQGSVAGGGGGGGGGSSGGGGGKAGFINFPETGGGGGGGGISGTGNVVDAATEILDTVHFRTLGDLGTLADANGIVVITPVFEPVFVQTPPVANAGPDQTVECADSNGAAVTLDGSGSSDANGDTLTYTWTGPFGTVGGVQPTVTLPLGTHTITLTVDDGNGGTASDTVNVTVEDTTAPVVSCNAPAVSAEPDDLTCGVTFDTLATASDSCDSTPTVESDPVLLAFSEIGDHVITFTATDADGNSSTCETTVTVLPTPFCEKTEDNNGSIAILESLLLVDSGDSDLIDAIGFIHMSVGEDDARAGMSGSEVVFGDPNHVDACHGGFKGPDVFQFEQQACDKLDAYVENDENAGFGFDAAIEAVRQALASSDQSLASTAIVDAIAAGGEADLISVAEELKAQGDAAKESGKICDEALDKYEEAWEKAVASYCQE